MSNIKYISSKLSDSELWEVANIHYKFLNTSFLAQLGPKFLFHLYRSIDDSSSSHLVVAKDNENVIGFVTGAKSLKPIFIHLIKHSFFKVTYSIIPHLFSPTKLKKIFEVITYSKAETNNKNTPSTELLSLAVKNEYRRIGIAEGLFKELIHQFKKSNLTGFKIVVGNELSGARRFYEKMGATSIDTVELHEGNRSIIYQMKIS